MVKFSPAFIDALLERTDLIRLVEGRVPLKKKGKDFWACCPFHQEKSPSFSVSQEKQIYYCFGCHAHGNAIGFLMAHDRLSFPEAVALLAEDAGVALPEEAVGQSVQEDLRPFRQILDKAVSLYRDALVKNPAAQQYWQSRGLHPEIITRFELGYAPPAANFLSQQLGKDENTRRALIGAGLVSSREDHSVYDRFRDRVIFPIRDGRGHLVGLGGRSLDGREPKYLNSPEGPLYHKGQVLYGLHQARDGLRRMNRAVLVEGYLDVITLHQAGLDYAVAASGTALGESQLQMLFRAAAEILLCFDGDAAGRKAAWRAVQMAPELLREGRLLRVLFLPDGQDPDSLVREQGAAALEALFPTARPAIDFFLDELQRRHNIAAEDEKAQFLREAREFLQRIKDATLREVYLHKLQELCGLAFAIPSKTRRRDARVTASAQPSRSKDGPSLFRNAMRLLLNHPDDPVWQQLEKDLLPFASDPIAKKLDATLDILANMTHLSSHELLARLAGTDLAEFCYALVMSEADESQGGALLRNEIPECVHRVNRRLSAARLKYMGHTADRSGLGALTEQERTEIVLSTRRGRHKRPES
ncbi:DNA primase [Acidithiobacillus thiooxidans]|uniref:DNA primase n=1 Tax=Acidithiobacillus thiooxidans TaxID=930 RepID=UPI001C077DD5|nr:DNA primase [Acidithiobacillus thiooxidans]MBU2839330.1 DNA primase [Acidithiobacillus thiooxidans]